MAVVGRKDGIRKRKPTKRLLPGATNKQKIGTHFAPSPVHANERKVKIPKALNDAKS